MAKVVPPSNQILTEFLDHLPYAPTTSTPRDLPDLSLETSRAFDSLPTPNVPLPEPPDDLAPGGRSALPVADLPTHPRSCGSLGAAGCTAQAGHPGLDPPQPGLLAAQSPLDGRLALLAAGGLLSP